MDIDSIDLNLLATFDAIEHERNITLAASRIGVTQPAMSNALARLRRIFNDPLFVRAGRKMQPTPFAERLAEPIRQSCALINYALAMEKNFEPGKSTQQFNFYMTDIGEVVNLPVILNHLRRVAPNITIKVASILQQDLRTAMAEGEVNIALGPFPSLKAEFFEQRLYSDSFVCIARNGHPKVRNTLTYKQFCELPHAVVESAGHEAAFEKIIRRRKVSRCIAVTVPHFMALPVIVGDSDLIATIPLRAAESFSHLAKIKLFKVPLDLPRYDIKQHWHERFHRDPANQWMRNTLAELFLGDPKGRKTDVS